MLFYKTVHSGLRADVRALCTLLAAVVLMAGFTPLAQRADAAEDPPARDVDVLAANTGHLGAEPDGPSEEAVVSDDGRFVVFQSQADNLLAGQEASGYAQLFRRDLSTGEVELVTVTHDGRMSNGGGDMASVSADGRYVAFESASRDLVPHDYYNGNTHLFIRDMELDTTVRVGLRALEPKISDDGSKVLYKQDSEREPERLIVLTAGDEDGLADDVLWEADTAGAVIGTSTTVPGTVDAWMWNHNLSGDGNVVAWHEGWWDDTTDEQTWRLKVRDLRSDEQVPAEDLGALVAPLNMNNPPDNMWPPALSDDGRYVAYHVIELSRDLVYVRDRTKPEPELLVESSYADRIDYVELSDDARHVVYSVTEPGPEQLERYDGWHWWNGQGLALPLRMDGMCYSRERERDGVATQLYRLDRETGATQHVTATTAGGEADHSCAPDLSGDGTTVVFQSYAGDLVAGATEGGADPDWDVFAARLPEAVSPPTWPAGAALRVGDVSATTVRLDWDPATAHGSYLSSYRVYRGDEMVTELTGDSEPSALIDGLTPSTTYAFGVEAVDGLGAVTPRLTVEATTAAGAAPGTAPLLATVARGGTVTLSWDPAADATGYRVMRARGTGDPVQVAQLPADERRYIDASLPAGTSYRYLVTAVIDGEATPHTVERTVEVPPVVADALTATVPRAGGSGTAVLGEQLALTLTGDPGRRAEVTVAFDDWFAEGESERQAPALEEAVVALTEKTPGVYAGAFPLRAGIAAVHAVTGRLSDEHAGTSGAVTAPGFPLGVSGSLRLSIDAPAGSLPGARLIAWSDSRRSGSNQPVTGGGTVQLTVPAANDYVVRVQRVDGREAARAQLAVRAGMGTSGDLVATLPAELAVRLLGPDGKPMNAAVTVEGTNPPLAGAASTSAPARLRALDAGTTVRITAAHAQRTGYLQRAVTVSTTLEPGLNEVDVSAVTLPRGTLSGRITGEDGRLTRASITATQQVDGLDRSFTTRTDSEGRYTLPLLVGPARIEVTSTGYRPEKADVTMAADQTTTRDLELDVARSYSIGIRLLTKYLGDKDFVEQELDWRVAVHFGLRVTTPDGQWIGRAEDPTTVVGAPGEQVSVCASGREAGLPDACETVTLPPAAPGETGRAVVELRLAEAGALRTRLLDPSGASYEGFWQGALLRAEPDGSRTLVRPLSGTGAPRTAVPSAGAYVIELSGGGHRWRSPAVEVPEGQEVVAGPLQASAGGPFAGRGNSVDVGRTTVLPDATVEVRTAFQSTASTSLGGAVARLEVPGGTTLVDGSVLRDGQQVDGVVARDGFVEVPLGTLAPAAAGVLRHQVRLDAVEPGSTLAFHSSLRTSQSGADGHLLGSAQVVVAGLTLSAPRRAPSTEVPVSGRAPAGTSVGVYSEGVLLGRAQSTPGGFWSTRVTLPDLGDLHTHVLSAEAEVGARTLRSDTEPVTVDANHLVAAQVSVQQTNGRRITFDPSQGVARFPYVFVPGHAMVVEASFPGPERVENVRVRIGTREAPATFVDGVWRATLHADGRGGIYVDYDVLAKPARADEPGKGPLSDAKLRERLPAPVRDFRLRGEPTYSSDGDVRRGSFTVDLPRAETSVSGTLEVEKDQSYTVTAEDAANERRSGSPLYGLEISERREGDRVVVELSAHVPQDQLEDEGTVEAALGFLQRALGGDDEQSIGVSSAATGAVVQTARIGFQYAFNVATNGDSFYQALTAGGKYEDIDKLYAALDGSGCDSETKENYRPLVDLAAKRALQIDGANVVLTIAGAALAPATFGMGTVALWGIGWVAGKAMDFALAAQIERAQKAIGAAAAFCKREGREDLPIDDGRPPTADPVWIFDPSGFVYEAVPSNRLSGVTATVFQKDEQAGTWAAWDAEWFGQDNPQVTGADGRYAWDVPAGLWQVVYEKEGYARAQSAELRVLPPHVDVNVGLVSLAAPEVEAIHATAGGPLEIRFDRYMQPETVLGAVTVRRGGATLTGDLVPTDAEASPAGPTYARTFRFTSTAPLLEGEVLRVTVGERVESYAQRPLDGDVERDVTVATAPTVPGAPRSVTATAGNATATVSWQAPEADGGSAVTGYTVTSEPATTALSLPADATQAEVVGLTNGTAYRFTVAAVNALGTGPGATSDAVTPRTPTSGGGGGGGQPSSPPTSPPSPLPTPTSSPSTPPTTPPTTPPAGGSTGSSSDGPPSQDEPVVVKVMSPKRGDISFEQGSGRAPRGFDAAGVPWVIEAPGASVEDPLQLVFRVDSSAIEAGVPVGVFRDGALVTGCTADDRAEPDPCLLRTTVLDDGDVELVVLSSHASTWQLAQPRPGSLDAACDAAPRVPFADVEGSVHQAAIGCLAGYGVTTGTSPTTFGPTAQVTRAQMASFVVRMLDRAGVQLPAEPDVGFADVPAGATHAAAIGQLAELGVVRGFSGNTYRPGDVVSRAQMASFLSRAYDLTTEAELPSSAPFDDVRGDAHEQAIGTIGALGITEGVTPTQYVPGKPVTREQMASFLTRTLNLLVVAGRVKQG